MKICQQVNKIDMLESKINFILNCLGKSESDFTRYENIKFNFKNNLENSKIIKPDDFYLISTGIQEKLNKSIKDIKLIYRASKDGDKNEFELKCKGKTDVVLFIKSTNKKRFGGFFNKGYNFEKDNMKDPYSFLFSLDYQECYYLKEPNDNLGAPSINNNIYYAGDPFGANPFNDPFGNPPKNNNN